MGQQTGLGAVGAAELVEHPRAAGSLAGTVAVRTPAQLPTAGASAVVACWTVVLVLAAGALLDRRDA